MSPSVSARLLGTQSDARLVAFARAGHERAFEALVRRYRGPLLGYCRRLLLSEERAEDALQQALMQAWLALRAGTEVQNAKAWLYRIVHNSALNALRVSGYDYCTLSESLSGADAPQEDLDRRIAVREALAGLAALPQMQREALLRTAVEGSSHREAARELGLSEPALRGLVYRARATLRATAGAFVPAPVLSWALGAGSGTPLGERVAEVGVGGGGAGVAGLLMKGGAMAVTAGVLAGGIAAVHVHRLPPGVHRALAGVHHRQVRSQASQMTTTSVATASLRPVAGVRHTPAAPTALPSNRSEPRVRHLVTARRHGHPVPVVSAPARGVATGPSPRGGSGDRGGAGDGGGSSHDGPHSPGASGVDGKRREGGHEDGGHRGDGEGGSSGGAREGASSGDGTNSGSTSSGLEDGGGDLGEQSVDTSGGDGSHNDGGPSGTSQPSTATTPTSEPSATEGGKGD